MLMALHGDTYRAPSSVAASASMGIHYCLKPFGVEKRDVCLYFSSIPYPYHALGVRLLAVNTCAPPA